MVSIPAIVVPKVVYRGLLLADSSCWNWVEVAYATTLVRLSL